MFSTPEIAEVFQKYYSTLRSIKQMGSQEMELKRTEKIKEYLKKPDYLKYHKKNLWHWRSSLQKRRLI